MSIETRDVGYETAQRIIGTCREWIETTAQRCNAPSEFVLWGKLIPAEGLGPRCYDHAAAHVGHRALHVDSQHAVIHIGHLAQQIEAAIAERNTSDNRQKTEIGR